RRDHRVGVVAAGGHSHFAVVDLDLPATGTLDVEEVRVRHPRGLRFVDAALERVEELLCACHAAESTPGGSASGRQEAVEARRLRTGPGGSARSTRARAPTACARA